MPIGVFDSGIGGLTVLRGLLRALPGERFVYFGDTARVPYGTKSSETVLRYSREIAAFLVGSVKKPKIKMLVIACNTASAVAAKILAKELPVPVIGVVEAGAQQAAKMAPAGTIAVIATKATIKSSVYVKYLKQLAPKARVIAQACPLFVPLVEEGWSDHPVTRQVARIYLNFLAKRKPDVLILGCTHYPMIQDTIEKIVGRQTVIVDSPSAVADCVKKMVPGTIIKMVPGTISLGAQTPSSAIPRVKFFISDDPARFKQTATLFLGQPPVGAVKLTRF